VGQTDNSEIYGGPHVIFSNIMFSILFKIKHNIMTTTHYYYFKTVLHCYLFADVCCTFSFSSRSPIQCNNPFKKLLRKLLDLYYKYYYTTNWSSLTLATMYIGIVWTGSGFLSWVRYYWKPLSLQISCVRLSIKIGFLSYYCLQGKQIVHTHMCCQCSHS
jgi:hypothetical protein